MGYKLVVEGIFDEKMSNREHATRVFREHITEVQATIAAERLLTLDLREGWEPLCTFLGVPIPDVPFPKTNSSKEFREEEWND